MLIDFKDEDFDNKIKNEDVSVVQFSAAWCGPCKALKPVMDKLAVEFKDKAGFYYADIEDGGINTGSAAGIRGVPTVIIYKKGIEVDRKMLADLAVDEPQAFAAFVEKSRAATKAAS